MQTLEAMHNECNQAGFPCGYWGERESWLVVIGRSRDSEALEEANFQAMLKLLGGESDTIAIERENHWACGWVEYILLDPTYITGCIIAGKTLHDLEDYPIIDDELFSQIEHDRFWEYAKSELKAFDGDWETILDEVLRESSYGIGDSSAESLAIEEAREQLEEIQELFDVHAACHVDYRQMRMFA